MNQISKMTRAVVLWIEKLIPMDKRDPFSAAIKLQEELGELMHALYMKESKERIGEEIADCVIVLLDIAYLCGIDVESVFEDKMEKNRHREWNHRNGTLIHKPDEVEDGYCTDRSIPS